MREFEVPPHGKVEVDCSPFDIGSTGDQCTDKFLVLYNGSRVISVGSFLQLFAALYIYSSCSVATTIPSTSFCTLEIASLRSSWA